MTFQPEWKKLGLLYSPQGKTRHAKLATHAANPLALHMANDVFRVYYSGRDEQNRSSVGAVDIDIVRGEVVKDHFDPFLIHGAAGSFFADGISIGNHYQVNGSTFILFMGWQTPAEGHWRGDIGRIIVTEDLTLQITDRQPYLALDSDDPISLSYPWVMQTAPNRYDMWYGSTLTWEAENGEMVHIIKHAQSADGVSWHKTDSIVPYQLNYAQAFSRPSVIKNSEHRLDMWFSYRCGTGQKYRIGYAYNTGEGWQLALDNSGINVSESGWDSEMIEYPFVFQHKSKTYMLYCGNGYGRTGFGLAVLNTQ